MKRANAAPLRADGRGAVAPAGPREEDAGEAPRIALRTARITVVDKPAGLTSEDAARTVGGKLVHRIDAATSGLLLLADDARTVQRLQRALRAERVRRDYVLVAHGAVADAHLATTLVRDRGDGLRGSGPGGKPAALDVRALQVGAPRVGPHEAGARATLCAVTLATGRTHQIRIQLAEAGHPLVGERVYVRDARAAGVPLIDAPRLLLHARSLAFVDPTTKRQVDVTSPPPAGVIAVAAGALAWREEDVRRALACGEEDMRRACAGDARG